MTDNKAKIKEIFSSIQGEGLFIGTKQLFIRFCACNLRCNYCDTDYLPTNINDKDSFFEFTPDELIDYLNKNYDLSTTRFISLTGGEPLIWNEFLIEFMSKLKNVQFYLETNATITDNLEKIMPYVGIIAADIKLPSCSGIKFSFDLHDKFFQKVRECRVDCAVTSQINCDGKLMFAKIIFDDKITDDEISKCIDLGNKYDLELILQPKMVEDKIAVDKETILNTFENFASKYRKVRLIPQVHKFLDIE